MDPATIALASAAITGGSSILGGWLSRGGNKETRIQKRQRHTIDDLIRSLKGKGPYSDLFNMDEAAFQKSYVEPAKQRFRDQIAPQIQQSYIATGQQRSSGLEDQLLRAGVDLDQILNQQYATMQENVANRKSNAINSILNQNAGAPNQPSTGETLGQAASGYLSSDAFANAVPDILAAYTKQPGGGTTAPPTTRKGFEPTNNDWMSWQLGDKRWNQ